MSVRSSLAQLAEPFTNLFKAFNTDAMEERYHALTSGEKLNTALDDVLFGEKKPKETEGVTIEDAGLEMPTVFRPLDPKIKGLDKLRDLTDDGGLTRGLELGIEPPDDNNRSGGTA